MGGILGWSTWETGCQRGEVRSDVRNIDCAAWLWTWWKNSVSRVVEPSKGLCGNKSIRSLQFFFAIFLGAKNAIFLLMSYCIVSSWCFKTLGNPFSHQSNNHTYHEIRHDFPTVGGERLQGFGGFPLGERRGWVFGECICGLTGDSCQWCCNCYKTHQNSLRWRERN